MVAGLRLESVGMMTSTGERNTLANSHVPERQKKLQASTVDYVDYHYFKHLLSLN